MQILHQNREKRDVKSPNQKTECTRQEERWKEKAGMKRMTPRQEKSQQLQPQEPSQRMNPLT